MKRDPKAEFRRLVSVGTFAMMVEAERLATEHVKDGDKKQSLHSKAWEAICAEFIATYGSTRG